MIKFIGDAASMVAKFASPELLQFINLQEKGDRLSTAKRVRTKLVRKASGALIKASDKDWVEMLCLIERVFGEAIIDPENALQALNALRIPVSSYAEDWSAFGTSWPVFGKFCYCLLAVMACRIEVGDSATHWTLNHAPFEAIDLRAGVRPYAISIIPPDPSAARSKEEIELRQLFYVAGQISTPAEDAVPSEDDDQVVTRQRMSQESSAKSKRANDNHEFDYNQFLYMMSRYRQDTSGPADSYEDDDGNVIGEAVSPQVTASVRRVPNSFKPIVMHPDVSRLHDIRMAVYKGNPTSWRDYARPTTVAELELWFPGSARDQATFLITMGEECLKNDMLDLSTTFFAAAKELNNAKHSVYSSRIPQFTEALFATLAKADMFATPATVLFATVWNSIIVPMSQSNSDNRGQASNFQFKPKFERRFSPPRQRFQSNRRSRSRHRRRSPSKDRRRSKSRRGFRSNKTGKRYYVDLDDHINSFLRLACKNPKTSAKALQRALRKAVIYCLSNTESEHDHPAAMNSAMLVQEYQSQFQSGDKSIRFKDKFPNADAFKALHISNCDNCGLNCSGNVVYELLKYGWKPKFNQKPSTWRPRVYELELCRLSIRKEVEALIAMRKIKKVQPENLNCVLPMKIVLKNDHIQRAAGQLKLSFARTERLGADEINRRLMAENHPVIKTRLVTDFRAGKWNDCLDELPFSYASVHDALALAYTMHCPCFVKIDFSHYFLQIPLADEVQKFFGICSDEVFYAYTALPFGVKTAPLVASLVSSELVRLANLKFGIKAISYIDDILIVSDSLRQAETHKQQFINMLQSMRFEINFDKVIGPSQEIEFLGYAISAIQRPFHLSFNLEKISMALSKVNQALALRKLSYSDLSSLAGTLLYISEVLLLGWSYTLPLWACTKGLDVHHRSFKIHLLKRQLDCLEWWKVELSKYSATYLPHIQTFPRPSTDEFIRSVRVFTDASGEDGYSYHTDDGMILGYDIWPRSILRIPDMMYKEIYPLHVFLVKHAQDFIDLPLIWLSDNSSAIMTVNAGAARDEWCNTLIQDILVMLDQHRIVLLAIWIPRHMNFVADYFSHALTCI